MGKYFFIKERDLEYECLTKKGVKNYMETNLLNEITVHPAVMDLKSDYFYCSEYGECGVVGESCGEQCDSYEPRNGKNGRCRYSLNLYTPDLEKEIIINIKK